MINEMHERIPAYNKVNHAHCFLHVLNLVAMSLLKRLELPEEKAEGLTIAETDALGDIIELVEGIQDEGDTTLWSVSEAEDSEDDETYNDNLVDRVDEVELAPEKDLELKESLAPITRTLVKVNDRERTLNPVANTLQLRKLAFETVHSTDLLPT